VGGALPSHDAVRGGDLSVHLADPKHEIAYQKLVEFLKRETVGLSAIEMLAVAANMLGKMIALQDQRTITPAMAMKTVAANIEMGNQQAMDELSRGEGSA
jgi:hypothetical protein